MMGLRDGEKTLGICVTFYTQYRRVGQTDRRTDILPRHSPRYAYASRGKNTFVILWLNMAFLSSYGLYGLL